MNIFLVYQSTLSCRPKSGNVACSLNPAAQMKMQNRLSFAELKAQKGKMITNLEAIKGGNLNSCHSKVKVEPVLKIKPGKKGSVEIGIKIKF